MKKKLMSLALALAMCVSLSIPAFAEDINSLADNTGEPSWPQTNEAAMPAVPQTLRSMGTLSLPARQQWVDETTQILEDGYHQQIKNVHETATTIVFEFSEPSEENFVFGVNYIQKEEYFKPEAQNSTESAATKISYVYGFADGMYENGTFDDGGAFGNWSSIKDLILTIAGLSKKTSVAAAVLSLCGISVNFFQPTTPVKVDNLVQYYVINKVGMVKDSMTGMWVPLAYVGLRKDFRNFYVYEKNNGYLNKVAENVTHPNSYNNPTNPDATHAKAHFWDDNWIKDKALHIYEHDERAYMDVYILISGFFHDTYPTP
ncbi:hypothetical protein OBV_04360 [Oscillibacter valericigenes Sjm18-20]|nr:hypothetical protein OBV_04360 [Oscillibacter valericigenes Sjm18-20]